MKGSRTCKICFDLQGVVHSCFSSKGLFAYCVEIINFFAAFNCFHDYGLAADECFVNNCNVFEHCAFVVLLHIHRIENGRETESVMYLINIISVLLFL